MPFACFDIYSMPKSNWLLGVNLQQNFQRCGRVDGEKEERRNTLLHHIVYNNVPHHFCTLKRVALGCFLVSSTWKLPSSPAHFVMSTCIKHQLFKSGMTFLTDRGDHSRLASFKPGFFYNITWAEERGESLPDLEFFPRILSYLLEFLVFSWVLSFLPSISLQFSFKILHFLFKYLKLVEFYHFW